VEAEKWLERCPDCPPGDEPDGAGMWWDGDCVVICETCGGSGTITHPHQDITLPGEDEDDDA
jgi:hypothetical protein